jgi:hypothetical protein
MGAVAPKTNKKTLTEEAIRLHYHTVIKIIIIINIKKKTARKTKM